MSCCACGRAYARAWSVSSHSETLTAICLPCIGLLLHGLCLCLGLGVDGKGLCLALCTEGLCLCLCLEDEAVLCRLTQRLEAVLLGLCRSLDLRLELPLPPHNLLLHDLNLLLPLNHLDAQLLVADLLLCLGLLQLSCEVSIGALRRHLHVELGLLQLVVALWGEGVCV